MSDSKGLRVRPRRGWTLQLRLDVATQVGRYGSGWALSLGLGVIPRVGRCDSACGLRFKPRTRVPEEQQASPRPHHFGAKEAFSERKRLEGNAYLGELSAGIIYLLAGARLALLGIRTGETPERFLGAGFMMSGASGILYCLPDFEIFGDYWTPLFFAARVAYLPCAVLIAAFTARVFRPDDGWARWLVWGVAVLAAAEAFLEYRQARRRVRIGLCKPSVCNRVFLWSLFGVIQFASCFVVIGQYAAYGRENLFSSTWDFLYSGTMLVALLVMWIAFFPPKIYVRWINGTAPVKL
jgi:hypothetical protein